MGVSWRIVKSKWAASAFDGEGARRSGGRWNSSGVRIVYTCATQSLAVLEVLVHLEDSSILPSYSVIRAEFGDDLVESLEPSALPPNWADPVAPLETQRIGDEWIRQQSSVVLRVPSVIVPQEYNYLLNPQHPDFPAIKLGAPQHFPFDSRLLGSI